MNAYALSFIHEPYEIKKKEYPSSWDLIIDLSVLKELIKVMKEDSIIPEEALNIASLKANQEMLKHRRSLTYLPGHKTTTDDLAKLIVIAQSHDPLQCIWKWINPMNDFDLADLYMNLNEYEELLTTIEFHLDDIKSEVLGTIAEYIQDEMDFEKQFAITFGFGIRGWVTDQMAGLNIEFIKDNYKALLGTIGHELFHSLQNLILSKNANRLLSFSDLVTGPYDNPLDQSLYEILAYIFLEGTGEIIQYELLGEEFFSQSKVEEGVHILNQCYKEIYLNQNREEASRLLNKGLQSSGPFYSLGKALADVLINKYSKQIIGDVLNNGIISFYKLLLQQDLSQLQLDNRLISKIKELCD